jgi:hypothetical protein
MIELKNKKTGKIDVISNEEYAKVKDHPSMSKFTITQLTTRPLIPSLKVEPKHKK